MPLLAADLAHATLFKTSRTWPVFRCTFSHAEHLHAHSRDQHLESDSWVTNGMSSPMTFEKHERHSTHGMHEEEASTHSSVAHTPTKSFHADEAFMSAAKKGQVSDP